MSSADTPDALLTRLSGVLGVDTVFYFEGKKVYLGVHMSAKRIESQMEALVTFTTQFPDYVLYVMGDFNVFLSQSSDTSLQVHSKNLAEETLDASNVQMTVDFHRPVSFVKPPVDTTCKRRWETTQGEKVGVSFSVKIDYVFCVHLVGDERVTPTIRVLEHDIELSTSRPPAPWYPADHFTLEVALGSDIFRSWNICGESQTSDSSTAAGGVSPRVPSSRPASGRNNHHQSSSSSSKPAAPTLTIAPNCFEFLTSEANAFFNQHPEITTEFHRILDEMPEYEGIRFRDRYLGIPIDESMPEEERKRLKAGEISSALRSCPSVNIHYKAFLLTAHYGNTTVDGSAVAPPPPGHLPPSDHATTVVTTASLVAENTDNNDSSGAAAVHHNSETVAVAVSAEGTATPLLSLAEEHATAEQEAVIIAEVSAVATLPAAGIEEEKTNSSVVVEKHAEELLALPKSPRSPRSPRLTAPTTTTTTTTAGANTAAKAVQQMTLLQQLWQSADTQFRATATPLQLTLYDLYLDFQRRLEQVPVIQQFLVTFFQEVVAFDRQDFLYVLLPALKTRRVKVWALQEVSQPLQYKLERHAKLLRQEYGYEIIRRENLPAEQKTWGLLLVRQELL